MFYYLYVKDRHIFMYKEIYLYYKDKRHIYICIKIKYIYLYIKIFRNICKQNYLFKKDIYFLKTGRFHKTKFTLSKANDFFTL